jgi:hypothetical protein
MARFVAIRLAQEGYGTPVEILRMPTDIVLDTLHFSIAQTEYTETLMELSKDKL